MLLFHRPTRKLKMPASSIDSMSTSASDEQPPKRLFELTPTPSDTAENGDIPPPPPPPPPEKKPERVRASKLEYKTVNQMYDPDIFMVVVVNGKIVNMRVVLDGIGRIMASS